MAEVETVHLRGEGGSVLAFDRPLPGPIADRVERGEIVRVNQDGTPYEPEQEASPEPTPEPQPEPTPEPEPPALDPEPEPDAKPQRRAPRKAGESGN